jgi:hypothetical protein
MRGRVAGSFLPLFGPLPGDTETVPANRYLGAQEAADGAPFLEVDDYSVLRLCTLSANVRLRGAQAADPEFASALIMFRRAAAIIARLEDAIVFNGQPGVGLPPSEGVAGLEPVYRISGGGAHEGLLTAAPTSVWVPDCEPKGKGPTSGQQVFTAVVRAVTDLERAGHFAPFACVLGDDLFQAVNTPVPQSMVLPRDSILPYLGGPLLRSSAIPRGAGLVMSMQSAPAEIVVGKDLGVNFLQSTLEGRYVFRVSERFVLRVKEPAALVRLES